MNLAIVLYHTVNSVDFNIDYFQSVSPDVVFYKIKLRDADNGALVYDGTHTPDSIVPGAATSVTFTSINVTSRNNIVAELQAVDLAGNMSSVAATNIVAIDRDPPLPPT